MFDPVLFAALMSSTAAFTPLSLFAAGEQGAWYDPSDLSTMFQDAAGTTPVTAVEQPVGLLLDKSKGLVLGAELVTNGDFSGGSTGWGLTNVTVSGGVATITGNPSLTQSITFVSGVTYRVSITVGGLTGGSLWLRFIGGTAVNSTSFGSGVQTFLLRSNGNTTLLVEQVSGTITAGTIDDISVKALPGNHASQSTAASRPVLKQDGNGKYYLFFDGVDDSLATGTIDFSATDKVSLFTGIRRLSDAAAGVVAELSSNFNSNEAFYFAAPNGANTNFYYAQRHVSVPAYADGRFADNAAPSTGVVTVMADRSLSSGEVTLMRQNGVSKSITRDNNGDTLGNFGNYPLYIGRRGGSTQPLNANLYSLIVRGALSTDAQIASTETYVNSKTGAY